MLPFGINYPYLASCKSSKQYDGFLDELERKRKFHEERGEKGPGEC